MKKRIAQLRRAIKYIVVDLDVFRLSRTNPFTANQPFFFESYGIRTPRPSEIETILGLAYDPNYIADASSIVAAQSPSAQLTAYQQWLRQQVAAGILQVPPGFDDKPWNAPYIESSYKKAIARTWSDINGLQSVASPIGGSQAAFLQSAFASPLATNQIQLLATRCFQQLEGVTAAMEQQMARILADGLAHGRSPRAIARELDKVVTTLGRNRSNTIARTEIIHAYAEGQLDTFEIVGKEDVTIMAEWSTAGDDRVCEACNSLEGVVLKASEARGLIPRHPNCRCAFIPYDPMFPGRGSQKDSITRRDEIESAIRDSVSVLAPRGTSIEDAISSSSWAGSTLIRP
jgi:SPP1 gp7 family putative phage head morphogenesis protein